MKIFLSEYTANYETYTFGYAQYALPQNQSDYDLSYKSGFLPYSASLNINESIFYFCRSLRIDTNVFVDNSENRRIIRKVEPYNIKCEVMDINDFDVNDEEFIDFCISYTNSRFSHDAMTRERFMYIISRQYANKIMKFISNDKVIGYTLLCASENYLHHWFCFFDTELMDSIPLGKYQMRYTIDFAKKNGIPYVYLGTCYNESGLYKVRDFSGVERRNGNKRDNNTDRLKQLCKTDGEIKYRDNFKIESQLYI